MTPESINKGGGDPLETLASLGTHDVDPWRAETLRREAKARLERAHRLASRRWFVALRRTYRLALEPAFVYGLAAVHLCWTFQTVLSLWPR
jgi:hypothetical protein